MAANCSKASSICQSPERSFSAFYPICKTKEMSTTKSYVTHETKHFICFYLGQVAILVLKSEWDSFYEWSIEVICFLWKIILCYLFSRFVSSSKWDIFCIAMPERPPSATQMKSDSMDLMAAVPSWETYNLLSDLLEESVDLDQTAGICVSDFRHHELISP